MTTALVGLAQACPKKITLMPKSPIKMIITANRIAEIRKLVVTYQDTQVLQ